MTREDELDLIKRAQAGDEASMATLVESNTGFAYSQAHKHIKVRSKYVRESVNAAALYGIMCGVLAFDASKGCRLTTIAAWHVMAQVQRVLKTVGSESTGDEQVDSYADELSDGHSEAETDLADLREHIRYVVLQMEGTPLEKVVARSLYIDGTGVPELADKLGVTRQRIDQVKHKVLAKLKIKLCKTL